MPESLFIPHDGIYLLNHSVGRPPRNSRDTITQGFFEPWESGDAEVWPLWIERIEAFRCVLGRLLNAPAEDFCPQVNLSSALVKIIYSLPRTPGRNVVLMSEQDFPTMGFVLAQAERVGIEVRMIPDGMDSRDLSVWCDNLSDDVFCALITQVYSNTGMQLPVADITRLCRERDVISIVDICQAVGVVPIDLQSWEADFALGSSVKWLCGGPGAGYLWASPNIIGQCRPVDVGWFSHRDPFEFDIHNFLYAEGALRFWGGTPSVLPFVLATGSIELICDIGVDRIRRHNLQLTDMLLNSLSQEIVVAPREHEARGGTVVLNFGQRQPAVEERLSSSQVRFDTRPSGIRLSPHIYNTEGEMAVVLNCLKQ